MSKMLTRNTGMLPSVFDDFMKPWNEWFDNGSLLGKMLTAPAVNITETKNQFELSVAVPGMKKDDFNIDVEGNLLTISAENEKQDEKKEGRMTRQEYNYASFSRTFTIPADVKKENIEARYEDGLLKLVLPKREEAQQTVSAKHIAVK
jgi:HSP20 family protein